MNTLATRPRQRMILAATIAATTLAALTCGACARHASALPGRWAGTCAPNPQLMNLVDGTTTVELTSDGTLTTRTANSLATHSAHYTATDTIITITGWPEPGTTAETGKYTVTDNSLDLTAITDPALPDLPPVWCHFDRL